MITGQLSKPLLSLRSDMSAAELRADDKAATPDSDLNDEPLLLSSETADREGTPNKLYSKLSCVCTSEGCCRSVGGTSEVESERYRCWDRSQQQNKF